MKKLILSAATLLFITSKIFSQIVINEIMYAPSDASNEWFEIFNSGNERINLQNWKWKDATSTLRNITSQSIFVDTNSYAVICQDSVKLKTQFPNLTGTIIQTAWSQLNNSGDNLILIDATNFRMDSVTFSSGWGGNTGGYSLERINPLGQTNNSSNWSTSVAQFHSTPLYKNSITPKPHDLFLKSFTVTPLFPSKSDDVIFDFIIKNRGLNQADNFLFNIYKDFNFDSISQNSELVNSQTYFSLNPGDSLSLHFSIQNIDTGSKQFIAKIVYSSDDDTLNNVLVKRFYVGSESGSGGIVINEIMYDPLSNQSEWIELFNATGQSVNIKGWKYKEATSSVILSSVDLILNPGDYFILAHDSTLYKTFTYLETPQQNQSIKFSTGISLNNTGESISLTDSLNILIDEVTYNPGWHNPELPDTKGISLERLNPVFGSNEKSNWSSSANIDGGTPGLQNSIYTKNITSNATVSISPNPFSPDGDGFEDYALIKYKLNSGISQMRVKIFDIKGRLVREIINNQISGSEGTIIFNGYGDDNQRLRIGIYILLIEAVDNRGGTVEKLKAPVVVAAKL